MSTQLDPTWARLADLATAWLLTYALHSTLLLGLAAWLSGRFSFASQETIWKAALTGGILTASVQLALGGAPIAAGFSAFDASVLQPTVAAPAAVPDLAAAAFAANPSRVPRPAPSAPFPWALTASLVWLMVAAAGLATLAFSYHRLRRRLGDREPVARGPAVERLAALISRAGVSTPVELSTSRNLETPIARGLARAEICVPPRALELPGGEQESLLAHELAHVARRDPAWLVIAAMVERTFFFQPLNRLARRRLREIAEFRADDWAAELTGDRPALARCLAEVAGWTQAGRPAPLPAVGMAGNGSPLTRRVVRLLSPAAGHDSSPRWLRPTTLAVVALVALLAPGFAATVASAPEPGDETKAAPPPAPEAPPTPPAAATPPAAPAPPNAASPAKPPKPPKPAKPPKPGKVEVPEVRVPAQSIPRIEIPEIVVPKIDIPELDVHVPEIRIPAQTIEAIEIPEIHVPASEIEIPEIEIPEIELPDLSGLAALSSLSELSKLAGLADLDPETRARIEAEVEAATKQVEAAQAEIEAMQPAIEAAHEAARGAAREAAREAHRQAVEAARLQREAVREQSRHVVDVQRAAAAEQRAAAAAQREAEREREKEAAKKARGQDEPPRI